MVLPRCEGAVIHTRFDALGEFLHPGDLLVVNNSRTLPALLRGHDEQGQPVEVRNWRAAVPQMNGMCCCWTGASGWGGRPA